jgi:O-methyltransferase
MTSIVRNLARTLYYNHLAVKAYRRYREFTMIPRVQYVTNLELCMRRAPKKGCIVECGVWRGGMSAGIADVLPGRTHFLFDSFEGLPPADEEFDGAAAIAYQRDKNSPAYYDNCRAEQHFAEKAMRSSAAGSFHLVRGWFSETINRFVPPEPIAVLRLDGDWYESTIDCLRGLYPHLRPDALVLIDDYYSWEGCARAVHDYLSEHSLTDRIDQKNRVCFLSKRP